jgi:hypothetical protein
MGAFYHSAGGFLSIRALPQLLTDAPPAHARGGAAAQVAHGVMVIKDFPHLGVQAGMDGSKPLVNILMNGAFAHAKALRRLAHRGPCARDILSQPHAAILNFLPHGPRLPSGQGMRRREEK